MSNKNAVNDFLETLSVLLNVGELPGRRYTQAAKACVKVVLDISKNLNVEKN